jgi:hypothetical protein
MENLPMFQYILLSPSSDLEEGGSKFLQNYVLFTISAVRRRQQVVSKLR